MKKININVEFVNFPEKKKTLKFTEINVYENGDCKVLEMRL